jgi:hydroxymethylbilane synthase
MKKIICATRGSKLALAQFELVKNELEAQSEFELAVEPLIIKTYGDKHLGASLQEIGGQGVFVKDVQTAVIEGRADFALHSAKDCPVLLPVETTIVAILGRAFVNDVVLGKKLVNEDLVVGTSSQRREVQLKKMFPKITIKNIRGNIESRISKLKMNGTEEGFDSIVLAKAGLIRLGLENKISHELSAKEFVPQVGQGALIVESRKDSTNLDILKTINDPQVSQCVLEEREFLRTLGEGCTSPCGCFISQNEDKIEAIALYENIVKTFVFDSVDGAGRKIAEAVVSEYKKNVL